MKQSFKLYINKLLHGNTIVSKYTINTRDNYALLARDNHQLAAGFRNTRGKSVLFQKKDYFECLSPHEIAA